MRLNIVLFLSLLFTALAMAPALAHLFAMLNKIGLPSDAYLTVQQIYRGWALLGIVVIGALLSTLTLCIMVRRHKQPFVLSLVAFVCILTTQVIFWTYTQPANVATANWAALPDNWQLLRAQWEYSHAVSAVFAFAAFVALLLAVLSLQRGLGNRRSELSARRQAETGYQVFG